MNVFGSSAALTSSSAVSPALRALMAKQAASTAWLHALVGDDAGVAGRRVADMILRAGRRRREV